MSLSDPIADFLTRLRNAVSAGHKRCEAPCSNIKIAIAKILKEQGYIADFEKIDDGVQGVLKVSLRYHDGQAPFHEIKRISKPGLRQYVSVETLPRVRNGLGVAIISTPKGVLTGKEAQRFNVGGEVLCTIW